jgi:hypothetical protein
MTFTIDITSDEYRTLFSVDPKHTIKNIIIQYKKYGKKNGRDKLIIPRKKNVKIDNVFQIFSVKYSTIDNKKIDVTNIVLQRYGISITEDTPISITETTPISITETTPISITEDTPSINNYTILSSEQLRKYVNRDFLPKMVIDLMTHFNDFIQLYVSFLNDDNDIFNSFIRSTKPISKVAMDKFFNDIKHGLFHGIMASFVCYLVNINGELVNKVTSMEQIFASATLHDFLKTNGIPQNEHDSKLQVVFNNLSHETYTHSNPPHSDNKKHLIVADRLELRRYHDYKKWADSRFSTLNDMLLPETKDMVDYFYDTMRPAMEKLYKHKEDIFIITDTNTKYVEGLLEIYPSNDDEYDVEIDARPGALIRDSVNGYITLNEFNLNGDKIINISLDKWIFIYKSDEITYKQWNDLHINNANMVPIECLYNLFELCRIVKSRIIALC